MKADTEILDEVVVVAYGTATKKSFTGSATEIKGEKISLKNPTELSKALSGAAAGILPQLVLAGAWRQPRARRPHGLRLPDQQVSEG